MNNSVVGLTGLETFRRLICALLRLWRNRPEKDADGWERYVVAVGQLQHVLVANLIARRRDELSPDPEEVRGLCQRILLLYLNMGWKYDHVILTFIYCQLSFAQGTWITDCDYVEYLNSFFLANGQPEDGWEIKKGNGGFPECLRVTSAAIRREQAATVASVA